MRIFMRSNVTNTVEYLCRGNTRPGATPQDSLSSILSGDFLLQEYQNKMPKTAIAAMQLYISKANESGYAPASGENSLWLPTQDEVCELISDYAFQGIKAALSGAALSGATLFNTNHLSVAIPDIYDLVNTPATMRAYIISHIIDACRGAKEATMPGLITHQIADDVFTKAINAVATTPGNYAKFKISMIYTSLAALIFIRKYYMAASGLYSIGRGRDNLEQSRLQQRLNSIIASNLDDTKRLFANSAETMFVICDRIWQLNSIAPKVAECLRQERYVLLSDMEPSDKLWSECGAKLTQIAAYDYLSHVFSQSVSLLKDKIKSALYVAHHGRLTDDKYWEAVKNVEPMTVSLGLFLTLISPD